MSDVLMIDRSKKFDLAAFFGPGWRMEEEDERSLSLAEIDLGSVRLEHMLRDGERWITGEERIRRGKDSGFVRLDAKVLETLMENGDLIPESWKEKTDGEITFILFDGTVLCDEGGCRYVTYLCWSRICWDWGFAWLEEQCHRDNLSAVLVS